MFHLVRARLLPLKSSLRSCLSRRLRNPCTRISLPFPPRRRRLLSTAAFLVAPEAYRRRHWLPRPRHPPPDTHRRKCRRHRRQTPSVSRHCRRRRRRHRATYPCLITGSTASRWKTKSCGILLRGSIRWDWKKLLTKSPAKKKTKIWGRSSSVPMVSQMGLMDDSFICYRFSHFLYSFRKPPRCEHGDETA